MDGPGTKPADNETESCSTRWTKEGKRLTYRLKVLQQPHRARACGSGAKCKTVSLSDCLYNC